MKSNNKRRAPDQATVTFSLPKDLLAKVDAEAKADSRTRSNFIVHLLQAEVERELSKPRPRVHLTGYRDLNPPSADEGNGDDAPKRKMRG